MENWLIYFAKINGLLVVFYLMYVLFLRKETFFTSNRWYLLLGLISSFVLPLITFTKTVWVESKPFIFREMTNFEPVIIKNAVEIEETFNWNELFIAFYLLITLVVLFKIGFEVISFYKSIKNQQSIKEKHFTLIHSSNTNNPFSFFGYIVVNQQHFSEEELNHILIHESIHVKQKHSFDVLLSRIMCALLWINPVVWLYRKAIIQNLEFIADHETFLTINNKHAYQKTLLKVVTNNKQLTITNQFFQSLIKKRIVMLNTNPSHKKNSWKYAVVLPVLVAFTLLFQIEIVAQEKENKVKETTYAVSSSYSSILTKNTSDREIKELEKTFSDERQKLTISNVKRNSNDEIIAIKLEFDFGKTYNRVMERKSDKGINSIKIYINSDENDDLDYGFEDVVHIPINVILKEDNTISKETLEKYMSLLNLYKNGQEVVLILNGKVHESVDNVKIDLNDEIGDMKEISANEFEKKYNKKAAKDKLYYEVNTIKLPSVKVSYNELTKPSEEKGLFLYNYILETPDSNKNRDKTKEKNTSGFGVSYETSDSKKNNFKTKEKDKFGNNVYYETVVSYETSRPTENIELIKKNKSIDYKKALIYFDGKEINYSDFEKINPNIISSVSIFSDKDHAIKKYGDAGKNGVIILESTDFYKKNNPVAKENSDNIDFILGDNEGFTISKNSKKEDLDFYKSTLAKSNIEFNYSGIKRNDKGEITSISINLKQKESKLKRNFKSSKPIPSLFIGKKKGSVVIEETN
ncbi:M56 family metallopeptidase [Flavobacterium lacus]|uniref:BlaR1 peptidase M56 n=1 Tax=Flavobacterium lacus TaxID=1353778 RepID=A0A328WVT9_9FLAO|nr:M56 family metallopeptidase [Flavobacterium lacus]RAR46979.1 BlaR1 peptidase M56 [Flavobacterium lacus]